jgi:hypothetical protein
MIFVFLGCETVKRQAQFFESLTDAKRDAIRPPSHLDKVSVEPDVSGPPRDRRW